jgi:hypothetical protein
MSCPKYKLHELGKLSSAEFAAHLAECPECRQTAAQDAELLAVANLLKEPVSAPFLWDKIEPQLRAESRRQSRFRPPKTWNYALRLAAVLVLIFGVSYFFRSEPVISPAGLLVNSALERVAAQELQYEQAISELEAVAQPKLSELDLDLQLLYRDKLETIDHQISRCKKALGENPANAHIRRYLLAALNDKKQTLTELVSNREAIP